MMTDVPGSAEEMHLRTQLGELQRRYNTLTGRIAALDTDIGRERESEGLLVLNERREARAKEREDIQIQISEIEIKLAGGVPALRQPEAAPARARKYLDFDLLIEGLAGANFSVKLLNSPAGEARSTSRLPWHAAELQSHLASLQAVVLARSEVERGLRPAGPALPAFPAKSFGQSLFDALISGEVRGRYDVSCDRAKREHSGLRLKLRIEAPELAVVPWELMYDGRQGEFVALSNHSSIVRYPEVMQGTGPTPTARPLRILGMVANPPGLTRLDTGQEKARIEGALASLRARGAVELTWLDGATWRDLEQALGSGPWHVFHFIGHGSFDPVAQEGRIAFVGEDGLTQQLGAAQLATLLADHWALRLVVLNSCEGAKAGKDVFSSTAATLVRRGISAVLAMQYKISDLAAIEFARSFYKVLLDNASIDAAVAEARKALSIEFSDSPEWGTPALYSRLSDGVLWRS